MTSGDGERMAPGPETPVSNHAAASAADLCYDSDDLLTQRRGVLPTVRTRPANDQDATPDQAEPHVPDVEPAVPSELAESPPIEESHTNLAMSDAAGDMPADPGAQPLSLTEPVVHHDPTPTNGAVAVLAPPLPLTQPVSTAEGLFRDDLAEPAPLPTLAQHEGTAPPEFASAPSTTSSAPPEEWSIPAALLAPDTVQEKGQEEPEAPLIASNGFAHHVAETAEYPTIQPGDAVETPDVHAPVHAPTASGGEEAPADDLVFEVPVPTAEASDRTAVLTPSEAPDQLGVVAVEMEMPAPPTIGISTEEVAMPLAEPIIEPATALATEPLVVTDPDIPAIPPGDPPAPPFAASPPPPPATPPPDEGEEAGATMTIIEHLEELRHRITISAISVVVGAVIGWFIVPHVVQYLEDGARKLGSKFFSPTILGPFGLELKLSFLIGVIIASPIVLFQIWGFIAPGLTRKEKRYALPFSLIGGILFAGGTVVGVLIVPLAIQFLTHFFQVLDLEQLLDINSYIMFIVLIAVIFGITFELPIFMVGFSLLGIVNSRFFIQKFRVAIFVIFGVSMVITPGADLVSPLVLGTFLIVLYWLGVLLIRIIGR